MYPLPDLYFLQLTTSEKKTIVEWKISYLLWSFEKFGIRPPMQLFERKLKENYTAERSDHEFSVFKLDTPLAKEYLQKAIDSTRDPCNAMFYFQDYNLCGTESELYLEYIMWRYDSFNDMGISRDQFDTVLMSTWGTTECVTTTSPREMYKVDPTVVSIPERVYQEMQDNILCLRRGLLENNNMLEKMTDYISDDDEIAESLELVRDANEILLGSEKFVRSGTQSQLITLPERPVEYLEVHERHSYESFMIFRDIVMMCLIIMMMILN